MTNNADARMRMLRARETVARRNAFFASILYHAKIIPSAAQDKTTWTNGINVFYNPERVVDPSNDRFIEGELLFQTMRCAFNHVSRRELRDKETWNAASEFALTPVVKTIYPLPDEALHDRAFLNMSAEEVYAKLPPPPPQNQGGQGSGKGKSKPQQGKAPPQPGMGQMQDPDPDKPEEEGGGDIDEASGDWERVVKVAADKAEKAGTMPGYLKRLIEEMYPTEKIDWRLMLDDMIREAKSRVSGSWARPNRRFIGHGVIMPGWTNDKVFRVILCLDTSGSVTDEQKATMKSEAMSLLDQQLCTHVTMISTDTRVCNIADVFTSEDARTFDFGSHGGGTDFRAAMKKVAEIEDAVGCVFFTDMQTSSFGDQPNIPVVWVDVINSGAKAPYGLTTNYK